jgi:Domain of Unknown Function (DUF748)
MLLAWALLPIVLQKVVETQGTALLGRAVGVQAVHVNPLTLTVTVEGLQIAGVTPEAPPLLALAQGVVNADMRSLLERAPVIKAVQLRGLDLRLTRLAEGRYDVDDIIKRLRTARPSEPGDEPARFAVYNVDLQGGQIRFDDRPVGRVHELRDLTLGLPFLSNLEDAVDVHVEPRLAFQLGDTRFDTGAQAKLFALERSGKLTLKTGEIDLAHWLAYLPASLPVRPGAGKLALDLTVQFKAPRGGTPEVVVQGSVQGRALTLLDESGRPLAELGGGAVQLEDLQPLRRRAAVRSVLLDGLSLHATRDDKGQSNWPVGSESAAAPAATARETDTSAQPPASAWQFRLDQLVLKNGSVQWRDQAVRPAVQVALEGVAMQIDALQWPVAEGATPARLSAAASVRLPVVAAVASAAPQLVLRGEWSAASGQLQSVLSAWPLAPAAPYLGRIIKPKLDGVLTVDATARWQGLPGVQTPIWSIAALSLNDLRATWPGDRQPAAAWKQLQLTDLSLDLAKRALRLGALALEQPRVRAHRNAQGQIDLAQWDAAAEEDRTAAPRSAPQGDQPWTLQLQQLAIASGQVTWLDDAAPEPVALDLRRLAVTARGLRWPPEPGARSIMQGSLQWLPPGGGAPGAVTWQGGLGLAPLAWRGRVKAEHLPLQTVAAYGAGVLPVAVGRAEAGWDGQVTAAWSEDGLTLGLAGDARVDDLRLFARQAAGVRDGAELLTWQTLALPGVQVALKPGQRASIAVGEAQLDDFYARLSVDETGQFNLAGLSPPAPAASAPGASASAAAAPASGPAATTPGGVDFAMAGLRLSNGLVDFSDRFVRPNYNADLSALNGRLGAFRSGTREMAALDLKGRVAGTGELEVRGALNPTAQPLALDIQARASELELAPLSPYAGKYAGYAIERGKLSMDVAYRIEGDGRLDARNRIVLNQLTFGERIESPEATKLPVLLAVALLKDSQGVIDLDLPVGGSINDPEFSVGRVVLKVIVNVLTKAMTAPFALLAGGGETDLSAVAFQPGTARLAASAGTTMDKVARALADRPALQMTVTGVVDPQAERAAIQSAWLEGRLAVEWRKEQLRAGESAEPGMPAAFPAEQRARLVKRVYADTPLPNKPRHLVGLAKDLPPAEMEALLRASHVVSTDNARELALQRGLAVRDALLAKGLPPERLFLASPRLRAADEGEPDWMPRAQLSLGMP